MVLFQNDPFREIDAVFDRMTRRAVTASSPAMDAYCRGSDVWVHLDMPGVSADSIEINLERNVLTVAAQRDWTREDDDQIYINERRQGVLSRQVHLGDSLDADHIEANYRDGVLTLRIPITERAQPRKIAVNTMPEAIDVGSSGSGGDGPRAAAAQTSAPGS